MSAEEEVAEHVHHAQDPFDKIVAGTMAIIAASLAIVSVLGQHYNTEKLLAQQLASDQWAYYQAKDIRHYIAQSAGDVLKSGHAESAAVAQYANDSERYKKQTADIQEKARELEKERDRMGRQADYSHFGEVFLELAIVLSSLSILTRRKPLFAGAVVSALLGAGIAFYGWIASGLSSRV
ncbi:MAG: hypothetical protein JWP08_2573 [Bryobacterales bacterium]|jgi:uncharacterized protein DUF4337|nr:hypothetical protein [Bryobacterales bacterium]